MVKKLNDKERLILLQILQQRFEANSGRHVGVKWGDIQMRLEKASDKLWSLHQLEVTGGEPDVIGFDDKLKAFIFCDCCIESPKDRRSLCYDKKALTARKENKPKGSAVEWAENAGVELIDEQAYFNLQLLQAVDLKTSSWLLTPENVRSKGGAIFGDCRYGRVFIYHNGAESYYAARGFRCLLKV